MTDADSQITPNSVVSLRPINNDNLWSVLKLKVAPAQEGFVASNAVSLAQAHFNKDAWYRAIYADETAIGFLMLSDDPVTPEYFLWRLMIAEPFQGNGFGRRAIDELVDYVKTRAGATELLVSHSEGEGNPGPFYQSYGFQYTGQVLEGELVMSLPLLANVAAQTVHPVAAQPLTHVVLFKLKDRSPDNLERTAAVLRSLDGTINVLRHIEVGVNVVPSARAYDVALITRFDSLADMEAYQVHPRHQEVLAFMREQTDTAAAVDYNTL